MGESARIGVVLSSGGSRGVFAHTGFLLALEEAGINIGAIAGCSAGALVGGIYASGTNLQQWMETLANVRTREYWSPDPWPIFLWNMIIGKGRGYTGLSDSRAAIEFIQRNLTAKRFEDLKIPFYSLALNLTEGTKMLFSEGDLAPRIMASAAMPLLYRPVQINDQWYSDGALIELAPTEALCCNHDLSAMIVHHTSMHRFGDEGISNALIQPWTMIEILYLILYRQRPWFLSDKALTMTQCPGGCGAKVIVIEPDLPELTWPLHVGGTEVLNKAKSQTMNLLHPYLNELKTDPRQIQ